jgi:hypothetical protein
MAKSKHRKDHKVKLEKYKKNKKIEQELLKKKMIDNYMKMQQQNLVDKEDHTSTQEVSLPDINIDELNSIDDLNVINVDDLSVVNLDDLDVVSVDDNINSEKQ